MLTGRRLQPRDGAETEMRRLEHTAIAQQRIEDAGEATGEGDHGHLFSPARGDAQGPGSQLLRLRRAAAEDRDGGLNQELGTGA
jgi:hypothetical protein